MFEDIDPSPEVVQRIQQAAQVQERTRITSIMALPEAMGREQLAMTLAASGIGVDDAKKSLAASPLAVAAPPPAGTEVKPGAEIGAGGAPVAPSAETARAGWKAVTGRVNETIRHHAGAGVPVRQ